MKHLILVTVFLSKFCISFSQSITLDDSNIKKCSFSLEVGAGIVHRSYREAQPIGHPFLIFSKISQRIDFYSYINIKNHIGIRASFAVNTTSMGERAYLPILEAQYNIKDNFNPHQGEPPTSYGIINRLIYGVGLDYLCRLKKTAINFTFIPGLVRTKHENFYPGIQHYFGNYNETIDRKIIFNERVRNNIFVTVGSTVRLWVNRRMSPLMSIKYFWMPGENSTINVKDSRYDPQYTDPQIYYNNIPVRLNGSGFYFNLGLSYNFALR